MIKSLIKAFPTDKREVSQTTHILEISEFYYDTIQGEGVYAGHPAAFLRLQGCDLSCQWCDTEEVWRTGNPYNVRELVVMILSSDVKRRLINGQHLVITGGSPLRQQYSLIVFLETLKEKLGMNPFVEIENECVISPSKYLVPLVDCWNNSPKLDNSGNKLFARYKPDVIGRTAELANSWFKFVVTCDCEWDEIQEHFIDTGLVRKQQIILMPQGQTREELKETMLQTVEMAVKHGVRYSSREHIVLWDKKTGV